MERESSKECSVFFLWIRKAFGYEIVFWRIQQCFLHGGAQNVLFWNSFTAAKFWKTFQVHFLLYGQENFVLKGNCPVNDVQIFMGPNSAGFITTLYLRKLIVHFFCIQIHRTFRSFFFVIALMLWQLWSYLTNEIICPILKRIVIG